MHLRSGLRLGGVAAALACAALVACGGGGGGGGGGSVVPVSSSTPLVTPSPTVAPTAQATTAALSTSTTTPVTLGAVSSGGVTMIDSATVTLPAVNVASNATVTLTAANPSGVPVPSARTIHHFKADTIGANTPFAYFAVAFSANVQITSTPAFSATFPSALPAGNYYVAVYDTSGVLGAGWNELAGPGIVSGATVTFAATTLPAPFTLHQGTVYVFAIISTANVLPTPTPTPSPTPTPVTTPTPTTAPTSSTSPSATPSLAPTIAPTTNAAGWSPSQVANQFQFPVQSGYNGSGQTVVVLGDYQPTQSDLTTYLNYYGITSTGANYSTVPINGFVAPGTDTGGQGEATLDMETVISLAPGAKVEYYAMPDLSGTSFVDAYTQLTNDASATIMTASFGGCEYAGFNDVTEDPLLAQAAAHGVIMFASSGDQGNECYTGTSGGVPQYTPGPNYPASDPNVVGVGGQENFATVPSCPTSPSNPSLTTHVVWNDCFFSSGQGAGGGGISALFTPPPYQSGVGQSASFRNIPDISAPSEGIAIYLQGGWATFGGTSWGAPLVAAMTAGVNEYCGGTMVTPLGSNPVGRFYTAYSRSSANFLDITSGNNQFATSTPFYSAAAGYDNASGLGIPYGMLVAQSLCPSHAPNFHPMTMSHGTAAIALDRYGEARDTAMRFVPRITNDLGDRGGAPVKIAVVMRATSTIAHDEQTVVDALRAAGFTITRTYPNHLTIDATAPASSVESFFQTHIHNTMQGQYGTRYANTSPVILPAAIAPYVHGAIVDNLIVAKHQHHQLVPVDPLAGLLGY